MKNRIIITALLFISLDIAGNTALGNERKFADMKKKAAFTSEAVMSPTSEDSVRIDFLIRIRKSALAFSLDSKTPDSKLTAKPSIDIELKDDSGIIRKRLSRDLTAVADPDEHIDTEDIYMVLGTTAAKGKYSHKIILRDNNRFVSDRSAKINASFSGGINGDRLIFAEFNPENNEYRPFIFEGNLPFNAQNPVAFISAGNFYPTSCKISSIHDKENIYRDSAYSSLLEVERFPGQAPVFKTGNIATAPVCVLSDIPGKDISQSVIKVKLPPESLLPGKYRCSFYGKKGDSASFDYSVIWKNKPKSLFNPEYAAELMYYILPDDEHKRISSGSRQGIEKKIFEYWSSRDSNPSTPFVEAMDVYFRRADIARKKYATVTVKNGAKTARGRIAILKGFPDDVEKTASNKIFYEIWTYKELNQIYTFKVDSPGKHILTKIEPLHTGK